MAKKILDTSVMIRHWFQSGGHSLQGITPEVVRTWARQLIKFQETKTILTPVFLEMIVGSTKEEQLRLLHAYLDEFEIVDQGNVLPRDWEEARRIGQRIPRTGKPRHLGDCLIRVIANRLKLGIITLDTSFPGK